MDLMDLMDLTEADPGVGVNAWCVYACMYVGAYVCVYGCMYMCVCMCVCMYVCMDVYPNITAVVCVAEADAEGGGVSALCGLGRRTIRRRV